MQGMFPSKPAMRHKHTFIGKKHTPLGKGSIAYLAVGVFSSESGSLCTASLSVASMIAGDDAPFTLACQSVQN